MWKIDFWQIGLYLLALLLLTPLLGSYMAKIFAGERQIFSPILGPIERLIYRIALINPKENMSWQRYAAALLLFSLLGFIATFFLQVGQFNGFLNPESLKPVPWPLAFNTAVSFVTNTNWQAYAGEITLSYLTQMLGILVQNFLSPASGIAVLLVLIRGLSGQEHCGIGNFWVDMTRAVLYLFLPLAFLLALALMSQGVIQNFDPYVSAQTLENASQILPMGPVAAQEAIKQLGSNGGGFFGVNSAHPFENPTPLSNFLAMLAILLIPAASIYMFGIMAKARRHAAALFLVMAFLFGVLLIFGLGEESQTNLALDLKENMEGKEMRFGMSSSLLWALATTATSNGSVNAMLDSFSPLGGGLALMQILLGEVIFGGVGSGLYAMLLFVMLTVFLSGLMVGRSPEYFGKRIEAYEIYLVLIALLLPSVLVLLGSSITLLSPDLRQSLAQGPHGLSQVLFAWASCANNNGSAFAGLNVNNDFFNLGLSIAMLLGRFGVMVPVLAIAQSLSYKKTLKKTQGTFETHGLSFMLLLMSVILIIGALTFMPAMVLGPLVEYFLMNLGNLY